MVINMASPVSPVSPVRYSSVPAINQPPATVQILTTPLKHNSSPAVVLTKSPIIKDFDSLQDRFFKVCGEHYGNGEVGQPAIDEMWHMLRQYTEQYPECKKLLPQKPINEKVSDEALAFIQSFRGGW